MRATHTTCKASIIPEVCIVIRDIEADGTKLSWVKLNCVELENLRVHVFNCTLDTSLSATREREETWTNQIVVSGECLGFARRCA